jgi:hypothetical protein
MMPRRLFFCHVPKTAGGALSRSVRSLFIGSHIIDFESSSPLFRISDEELASARLLTGHAGISLAHRLPADTLTMMVLRDPVKRVISTYNYFLACGVIPPGLKDFLEDQSNLWAIDNLMTWMLVHDHTIPGRRDEPYRDWSVDELRTGALEALRKVNIIGIAENLAEVIGRLEVIYEQEPVPLERVNEVQREVDEPTDEEMEIIRGYNELDQIIYDEAKRVKDEVWARTRELVVSLQPTNHFV